MTDAAPPLHVVDASSCIKWHFRVESGSEQALAVLVDYRLVRVRLVAPPYFPYEVTNVIRKRRENKEISPSAARRTLRDFYELNIPVVSPPHLLQATADLAIRRHMNVYDAGYAALAQILGCRVITADKGIINSLGRLPLALWIEDYTPVS